MPQIHIDRMKAYPSHRDPFAFTMGNGLYKDQFDSLMADGPESFKRSFEEKKPFIKVPRFYRKMKPNFNDPMTLYYILDILVDSAPNTYIRPTYLVPYLNERAPMFYWTVDLVGRMMAGLWECSIQTYLDEEDEGGMLYIADKTGDGEDIPQARRMRQLPFALGRDGRGKYYVVDPNNGVEGRFWLIEFRRRIIRLCYEAMQAERDGDLGKHKATNNTPLDFYIGLSPDPILSAQAFRANQAPTSMPPADPVSVADIFGGDDA